MKTIPEKYHDLLQDETRAFAYLATLMKDGSPQVTPLWFNTEGDYLLINSAQGRTKDRNMRRNPLVALAINDPREPYRYLQIRGRVVEITTRGADEHIDALAKKYTGAERYNGPRDNRVIYKIQVEHVTSNR